MTQPTPAAALVCRFEPRLAAHAARITAFLDASIRFSRDEALARGSAPLLQRVLMRELASAASTPLVLQRWVWTTLQPVVETTKSLPLVECLVAFVHPTRSLWDAVAWAIAARDQQLVEWLYARATATHGPASDATQNTLLREAVLCNDVEIVRWVLDQRSTSSLPAPARRNGKPLDLSSITKGLATATDDTARAKWAIVELLLERLSHLAHRSLPLLAAQQGRLHTIQVMKQHKVALGQPVANAAASRGHFDIVAFTGVAPTSDAMDDAAIYGNVVVLQQLHTQFQCELTAVGVLRAADNGHLAVLQWAYATFAAKPFWKDLSGLLVPAFTAAVDSGKLDVVMWLYQTHLQALLAGVAEKDRRITKTENVYLAFQRNHVDVVKFLHAHGLMDWDNWEGGNAAYYCDLPTLQWLHEHNLMGAPRNELTSAVYAGRLDCITWILANRPIEQATYGIEYAALHGRMEVLELLLARGLVGSYRAIDYAASKGHVAVIRRLVDHRRDVDTANESDQASPAAIHGACLAGHLEVVQYLTDHPVRGGSCTTTAMDAAASKGFVDIVQYLHKHRTEGCTVAAMDAAAANGNLQLVTYLHQHRTEGCSSIALENAAVNGHFEVVQFLAAHYPQTYSPTIPQRARARGELEIALWLEHYFSSAVSLATCAAPVPRRASRSMTTELVLPPATPIVG